MRGSSTVLSRVRSWRRLVILRNSKRADDSERVSAPSLFGGAMKDGVFEAPQACRRTPARERPHGDDERLLRPSQCRSYLRRELAEQLPGVVKALVESAKTGSYQHVKLMTDLLEVRSGETEKRKR